MTKREMYTAILAIDAVAENEEMVNFLNHQIELLDARKSSKTPTKNQQANEDIKTIILEVLTETEGMKTVSELLEDERLNEYTNQKISALLRQLIDAHLVVKTIEKKKSYFSLA